MTPADAGSQIATAMLITLAARIGEIGTRRAIASSTA
jgi:hypothetical protein